MTTDIYLDNAATTQVAPEVINTINKCMKENYGNPNSLHKQGRKSKDLMEKSRKTIASQIGSEPSEIIFTSGGTESDNLAIKGSMKGNEGNHIITTEIEHPAVLNTCKQLEKEGYEVTYLPVDRKGFIDLKELENSITEDTVVVSVMAVNNEIGTIQKLDKIGEICEKKEVLFHTDAVQAFTKIELDVNDLNIDLMSLSSHKIHGPNGVGALYVDKNASIQKIMNGGHQESDLRPGTQNVPGIAGFAKAVKLATDQQNKRMRRLRDMLAERLLKIPETKLNGAKNQRVCNNLNITFQNVDAQDLMKHLNHKGIAVSAGSACTSQTLEPSHVLKAIGLTEKEGRSTIRLTLSRYNTEEEMKTAAKQIEGIVTSLRKLEEMEVKQWE